MELEPAEAPRGRRPRGRSRAEKSAETRERILDVAELEFSKHGFEGVTLRAVARLARGDGPLAFE